MLAGALTSLVLPAFGCGTGGAVEAGSTAPSGQHVINVVAAENFWGSIAAQLGGSHVRVVSIITNPNTDPHSYEPSAADARLVAEAHLVVWNGLGYDPWVPKLLAADNVPRTLDVGARLGLPADANPHRWYDPGDVQVIIGQLVADYESQDPADRSYFERRKATYESVALQPYHEAIARIRARYRDTPIGASESIVAMLAPALGLHVVTPPSFLKAVSEGIDISSGDKETIDRQIRDHRIEIYVYNSQNVTPDIQAQLDAVRAAHIPYATITETMQPAGTTYQAWQTKQLRGIESALAASRHRG